MDDVISRLVPPMPGHDPALAPTHTTVPVRLATTCREDSAEAIAAAVTELVQAFHASNDARPDTVRVVIFTATADLRAAKPAVAARKVGWSDAQFLCLAEMPTTDDLPRCIRALLFVARAAGAPPLRPVYLNGTQALRPDIDFG